VKCMLHVNFLMIKVGLHPSLDLAEIALLLMGWMNHFQLMFFSYGFWMHEYAGTMCILGQVKHTLCTTGHELKDYICAT
jgi:hypothetical protein